MRASTLSLAAASLLATSLAFAQAAPKEGTDYTVLKAAQPTEAPQGKVEVIEFFGYWCPHCNEFEPVLRDWSKRNDAKVQMSYVPIAFVPAQANLAKLYYTLDVLGKEKDLRRKVYDAIHVDRSLPLNADVGQIADWAEKNGIEKKKFVDTFNSFTVQAKTSRATQIARTYQVSAVPTFAVDGKYVVTGMSGPKIGVADALVARSLTGK